LTLLFLVIICVSMLSYVLFLMRPYSEPIVTEGKIVEKYMFPDDVIYHSATYPGGPVLMSIPTFYIVILSEKGYKTKIRVKEEKYSSLEIDDPVETTEYSLTKTIVEKKRNLPSRNEEINN